MQNQYFWILAAAVAAYLFFRPGAPVEARMSPRELASRLSENPASQLIDVRTPGEFAEGRLKGAKNIPLDELQRRLGELKMDQPVLVYCRSGNRSATALRILHGNGFKASKHLEGGILAWQREGLPL